MKPTAVSQQPRVGRKQKIEIGKWKIASTSPVKEENYAEIAPTGSG